MKFDDLEQDQSEDNLPDVAGLSIARSSTIKGRSKQTSEITESKNPMNKVKSSSNP